VQEGGDGKEKEKRKEMKKINYERDKVKNGKKNREVRNTEGR
jgi:hypothetical protein